MEPKDISVALAEIKMELEHLSERFGYESEDGKGGTGLVGRVVRAEVKLDHFLGIKNKAAGIAVTVIVFFAIVLLGVKSFASNVISHIASFFVA